MNEPDAFGTCSCPCGCQQGGNGIDGYCGDCRSGNHGSHQ